MAIPSPTQHAKYTLKPPPPPKENEIRNMFNDTFGGNKCNILKVYQVQNNDLWTMFQQRQQEIIIRRNIRNEAEVLFF